MEEKKLNIEEQKGDNKKWIWVVLIIVGAVILISFLFKDGATVNNYLTYENYNKISTGMSYNSVVEIFDGNEGVLDSTASSGDYTISYYTWSNSSGSKIVVVGFENGYVMTKSQFGLR